MGAAGDGGAPRHGRIGSLAPNRMAASSAAFVWTPAARRSVSVLIALESLHMCANQLVVLASDDLLVELLRERFAF